MDFSHFWGLTDRPKTHITDRLLDDTYIVQYYYSIIKYNGPFDMEYTGKHIAVMNRR